MKIEMGKVAVKIRTYFSTAHLRAAMHFSEQARTIEDRLSGGADFNYQQNAYVTGTILSSTAFMEAAINELFQDASENYGEYIQGFGENAIKIMGAYWNFSEGNNKSGVSTLHKYPLGLLFAHKELFDEGANPYQDANLVTRLRNYLIHFKPETIGREDDHKLQNQLRGKFPKNVMLPGNPFPGSMLGAGCADWAMNSCLNFVNEFSEQVNIYPNYLRVLFEKRPEESA